ncbi:MAG: hypothetical protein COU42_02735 [Candidatus Nealsonbacteria bacterium CG10_big_fil_rev_8_21_14_0_10_36_24]|uniref:DUF1614 domain-containing protein n=2 Tax=Candidatus Nealsoniibacteriota TaxID=1817911 RepID=A0A2H0YPJ6_9BACT|nr:MAG: hypothetical protein COU42_02735 [Candidatus Nealsonbacteria bacterium CG10_big_fil_rev_8_21_14_0_10_36_24]PIS40346.1 MAG: hypothetical protein COT32_00250 [Candidatus Nealsonbacteria bacterium CG08_land_8_20_14_0_20_36_22]
MFFFPVGCLIFILFIFSLPILFLLVFFRLISLGFEKLGLSSEATILTLLLMLICSGVNIPLTRKKLVYIEKSSFFGLFKTPKLRASGITINLGGAIIPILLSFYFLSKVSLEPVLIATFLMVLVSKILARPIPDKGITIPAIIPPIFAVLFAWILAPEFMAPCAFVSGVLGTLIGADILNLRKAKKIGPGLLSIGGAGVFDGIFLVGIISALLA